MLKERILTALVLLPLVLWAVFAASSYPFIGLTAALVLIGAWEWGALMALTAPWRGVYVAFIAVGLLAAFFANDARMAAALWGGAVLWWLVAVRLVTTYPDSARLWTSRPVMTLIGWMLLVPAWYALMRLHQEGVWWLMYLFVLVWGADTGAYFAGRAFGKRKLAPSVSPGKTLEGLFGGLALTMAIAVAVALSQQLAGQRLLAFLLLSLLTVLASVLGDLMESMAKRYHGVKDSGRIFPGHGGALDRIDSLTAAAPVFMAGWLAAGGF